MRFVLLVGAVSVWGKLGEDEATCPNSNCEAQPPLQGSSMLQRVHAVGKELAEELVEEDSGVDREDGKQSGLGNFGQCPSDFPWAYRPKKGLDYCCKEPYDLDRNKLTKGLVDKWQRSDNCAAGYQKCEHAPCSDFNEDLSGVPEALRSGAAWKAATFPNLTFTASGQSKVISGRGATECKNDVGAEDSIGDLGLATMKYGSGCYAWSGYSNANYQVEVGMLDSFPTYVVFPPETQATAWVAGGTGIYYKFPTKQDYTVYVADKDSGLNVVAQIAGSDITLGAFTKTGIRVDGLTAAKGYVFVPSSTEVPGPVSRLISGNDAKECDMGKVLQSAVENLAVVATKYGSKCYVGCSYNNCDYLVERGEIWKDSESLPAYTVHPPARPASRWTATKTKLMYKTQQQDDLAVLLADEGKLMVWSVVEKSTFTAGNWVDIDVLVNDLSEAATFVFLHLGDSTTISTTTTTTTSTTTTTTTTTTTVTTTTTTTTRTLQASACSLDPLTTYTFAGTTSSPLEFAEGSTSGSLSGTSASECNAAVGADHAVGKLALVLTKYQGSCWSSPSYSCNTYEVKEGKVGEFLAYQVSPAAHRATSFVGSKQVIYYQFETQVDHNIYKLTGGALEKVGSVGASSISAGAFTAVGVYASDLSENTVFVAMPASQASDIPVPGSRTIVGTEATTCDESKVAYAAIGDVAVVTTKYGSSCWTDGRYNHKNFLVERGTLTGTDGSSYTVYKVNPPQHQPTQFSGSGANLYFKMPQQHELAIYQFDGRELKKASTVAASDTEAGAWVNTGVSVHRLTEPVMYAFIADGSRVSAWPLLASNVEGALLSHGSGFQVCAHTFQTAGHPFIPSQDWAQGPGTHDGNYGIPKQFHAVTRSDGREGVVWQDETALSVHCTWFSTDLLSSDTQTLTTTDERLFAASGDGKDSIALLLMARDTPSDKTAVASGRAVVVSAATGAISRESALDCERLDYHGPSVCGASMVWNTQRGTIGVVLARAMTMAGDGLNHQGATGFVLDADTLEILYSPGMSSHSFANSLIETSDGNFLAMDLGDNYPRGINLARFNEESGSRKGFVCYYMKTRHAKSAIGGGSSTYDAYPEISDDENQYYKWSNDNYIYTEIGHPGAVEVNDGIMVFFAGEEPPLDNSKVGSVLNEPRNLGFVKVSKDVGDAQILSEGPTETGGYFSYYGSWSAQENKGINFITNFTDITDSVSRLKTARLGPTRIVLMWEVWTTTDFKKTQMMVVDGNGGKVAGPWTSDYPIQLAIQDDVATKNGKVIAYAGLPDGKIVRYEICSDC